MLQSSITAWLKKPASVKETPRVEDEVATALDVLPAIKSVKDGDRSLPTPPPEAEEEDEPKPHHEGGAITETPTAGTATAPLEAPSPAQRSLATDQTPPHFRFSKHKPPPLIANITLEPCTAALLPSFKRLNTILLPIPYPAKFYSEILSDPTTHSLTLLALWRDTPQSTLPSYSASSEPGRLIGGIRCRILHAPPTSLISLTSPTTNTSPDKPLLYISTLTLLSPYRHHGTATHLLQTVLATAIRDHNVGAIGAHVWEQNDEARDWYRKRGFVEIGAEEGYYTRLRPSGAVVVRREVGVGDLLGLGLGG